MLGTFMLEAAGLLGLGKAVGAGIVTLGAGLGLGKIGHAAMEAMSRQPESISKIQMAMIIIGALVEGVSFFALIVCIAA